MVDRFASTSPYASRRRRGENAAKLMQLLASIPSRMVVTTFGCPIVLGEALKRRCERTLRVNKSHQGALRQPRLLQSSHACRPKLSSGCQSRAPSSQLPAFCARRLCAGACRVSRCFAAEFTPGRDVEISPCGRVGILSRGRTDRARRRRVCLWHLTLSCRNP